MSEPVDLRPAGYNRAQLVKDERVVCGDGGAASPLLRA